MDDDAPLMTLVRAIVQGDRARVSGLLAVAPDLALAHVALGASRRAASEYFLEEINHYVYGGDSALHIAAAAFEPGIVRELVSVGANAGAANRRDARPLHYAVDGIPGSARWNPTAQQETVLCLVELGADPNAPDKEQDDAIAPSRAQSLRSRRQGAARRRRGSSRRQSQRIDGRAARALDDRPPRKRVG